MSEVVSWALGVLGGASPNVLVGDHEAPRQGGWSDGDPNVGLYTPYYVVRFMGGQSQDSVFTAACRDWRLTLQVAAYGVSRSQATDLLSDAGDLLVAGVRVFQQVTPGFRLAQAVPVSLTAVGHEKTVNPHVWSCRMSVACDLRWTR